MSSNPLPCHCALLIQVIFCVLHSYFLMFYNFSIEFLNLISQVYYEVAKIFDCYNKEGLFFSLNFLLLLFILVYGDALFKSLNSLFVGPPEFSMQIITFFGLALNSYFFSLSQCITQDTQLSVEQKPDQMVVCLLSDLSVNLVTDC